jgi:nucleotide-binding universal stress UspA family protein
MTGNDAFAIHSILAAVDATLDSASVVETAAQLALGFNAELNGIFVEDINLLRLAGLPFARELSWSTAMELQLDYQRMERALRGHAAHAQQAVVNITTRLQLHASLQIVRGKVAQELIRATENVDLFILGKGREARGARIGKIARQVIRQAHSSVLLVNQDGQHYKAVMTIFTGDDRSAQVLDAAVQLARAVYKPLLVLIPAAGASVFQQLREQCRHTLGQGPPPVTFRPVAGMESCFNQKIIRDEGVGMVVIGAETAASVLETRLAKLECSALIVR